jgi:hypothetical protein
MAKLILFVALTAAAAYVLWGLVKLLRGDPPEPQERDDGPGMFG